MWCWTNALWVSFVYSAQGDSDSVRRFLGDDLRRPGCWSHARRGLVEIARAGDKVALEGLRKIAKLFAIERKSLLDGDTAAQRLARRREHMPAVSDTPILVIGGELDPVVPATWLDAYRSGMDRAQAVVVPGEGHVAGTSACGTVALGLFLTAPEGRLAPACLSRKVPPTFVLEQ